MTMTRTVLPLQPTPEADARQAAAFRQECILRESYTVGTLDVPGRGPTRRIEWPRLSGRGCSVCGATSVAFGAVDHSWYLAHALCDRCTFEAVLSRDDVHFLVEPADEAAAELALFAREHRHLGAALAPLVAKLHPRADDGGLFSLGQRTRPRTNDLGVTDLIWREFLARHAAGDHGEFGDSSRVKVGEVERFAAPILPIATRNRVAIDSGSGLVRSRYELPERLQVDAPEHHRDGSNPPVKPSFSFPAPPDRQSPVAARLDIATWISPGGNRTHGRIGRQGQQSFADAR